LKTEINNSNDHIEHFNEKLIELRKARNDWENGTYKTANNELYKIIAQCFKLVQHFYNIEETKIQDTVLAKLQSTVDDFVEKNTDIDFAEVKDKTKRTLVQCIRDYVFAGANLSKYQKSDYKRVIEIAMKQNHAKVNWTTEWLKVTEEEFVTWLQQGIHNITRTNSSENNETNFKEIRDVASNLCFATHSVNGDGSQCSVFPIECHTKGTLMEGNNNEGWAVIVAKFVTKDKFTLVPVPLFNQNIVDSSLKKVHEEVTKNEVLAKAMAINLSVVSNSQEVTNVEYV